MQTEGIEPPRSGLQPDALPTELHLRKHHTRLELVLTAWKAVVQPVTPMMHAEPLVKSTLLALWL